MRILSFIIPMVVLISQGFTQYGWNDQDSESNRFLTAVSFPDAMHGWTVGQTNTILNTNNGGEIWIEQIPEPSSNYWSLYFINANVGWACGSNGKIVNTMNSGVVWLNQTSGTNYDLWDVFFLDELNGWIVGGKPWTTTGPIQMILHTENGGSTWYFQDYNSGEWPLKAVFFWNEQIGWAVGELGYILTTSNGGENWSYQSSGTNQQLYDIIFTTATNGWIVGEQGTVLTTSNGGDTWLSVDIGTTHSLQGIDSFGEQKLWITGGGLNNGVVFHSFDGGISWESQYSGISGPFTAISFSDQVNGWAVGYNGAIIHTNTGGSDCEPQGDLNMDQIVNILDVILLVNCIIDNDLCPCADMDQNGDENILDIVLMVNIILS
ncbi:MAG: hypothetical protein HQ510_07610 [Candidatus Marinimicrobia bacterium]|nr:hypothetical protein [Candidatus Neomarinimicrobiota bacterium]